VKRLYASADRLIVGHLAEALQAHGVRCLIRNHFLAGAAGELPVNETWPEIWVLDDHGLEAARELLRELLGDADDARRWRCDCGEVLDPQFIQCWQCGRLRTQARGPHGTEPGR